LPLTFAFGACAANGADANFSANNIDHGDTIKVGIIRFTTIPMSTKSRVSL
jgi:hypothetical protein